MIKIPKTIEISGTNNIATRIATLNLEDYIAFSLKKGLPCKIMNGKVCDKNGVPFQNESMQDTLSFFTERVSASRIVVLGTIVPSGSITASFSDIADIEYAANSNTKRHEDMMDEYSIEVYDFSFELEPETITYATKRMMLMSMIRSSSNVSLLYTAPSLFGPSMSETGLKSFISGNAYSGKKTCIYNRSEVDTSAKFADRFVLEPYEVVTAKIDGFEKMSTDEPGLERTKYISVQFSDYSLKIPTIRADKKWARYMYAGIKDKTIKTFTFRSIYDLEKEKYSLGTIL